MKKIQIKYKNLRENKKILTSLLTTNTILIARYIQVIMIFGMKISHRSVTIIV